MAPKSKTVTIDMTSDIACPWCAIGRQRLGNAIEAFKAAGHDDVEFVFNYLPFQLYPNMDKKGMPKLKHLAAKVGDEQVQKMVPYTEEAARLAGLKMTHKGIVSNTFDAHRLLLLAEQHGLQDKVAIELYSLYHEKGRNVGEIDVLVSAYARVGGDRAAAQAFLKSDEGSDEIRRREAGVRRKVKTVPHFVFNGKTEISGAQETDDFLRLIERVASK
ncbi:thioredoxin-like protein [Entophlyctis helioformis]|nr:thioredoxin-like protein [Entophlyctis helioformis]